MKTVFSIPATIRPTTARTRYRSLRTDVPDNPDRADVGLMVAVIEKTVFNLYLDMLCVRPDRAKGGVGGCGSSHESVIGPDGMAAFLKPFPYLVIAGLFGFPDPYDLGANALERVA